MIGAIVILVLLLLVVILPVPADFPKRRGQP